MTLEKLIKDSGLSETEIRKLLQQPKSDPAMKTYHHQAKDKFKFGLITDTHIGHKEFRPGLLQLAGKIFRSHGITDVYHSGDITEGMSGRPGHVYELAQIGFNAQVDEVERLWKKYMKGLNTHAITGNHDDWYMLKNSAGANVGPELENRLKGTDSPMEYLGLNEADIVFGKTGVKMKLFHPNDGTAYATSYKLQKLVESLEGGKKPDILIEGHYHKSMYMFCRNVHCFEGGTLMGQSWFMRGKKIPAHMGFWEISVQAGDKGVESITPTFYPAYK